MLACETRPTAGGADGCKLRRSHRPPPTGPVATKATLTMDLLAYLDPGSGSMILQILAGGLAAVAVVAKLYWGRLLAFLRIRKPED